MKAIAYAVFLTLGQILAEGRRNLRLPTTAISRHAFIAGGSGNGKSRMILLLCRQLDALGIGFTLIDPHGDTAEEVAQSFQVRGVDPSRVHYLRPGVDRCFSFDPFAHAPKGVSRRKYESWLRATVERTVDAFLRNVPLADQEAMKRLKRWLGNVLYAAGVDVGGRHLGIADALVLTQPKSPQFELVLDAVRHVLPPEVLADFLELSELRSDATRNTLLESTINCLRDVLSPAVEQMFSQAAPSIDLREVILKSHFQLVNLRKSDEFSRRQRSMVGGLILNFLIHAAENLGDELPPEARVPHVLIIDEAENFIGEDLRMAFPELRKFKFCVVAVFQDLSCLRKGDLDLQGKVISQCGLQITFQQGNPDDFEYLAKAFGYGSLDLTPLLVDTVLPDGYEWADTESVSVGESESRSESHSTSLTRSESRTQTRMTSESIQRSVAEALSESTTEGTSLSRTSGVGLSWSQGETHTDGVSTSVQVSAQDGRSHTETRSESDSLGRSQQKGTSEAQGQNRAAGESIQRRAASMFDEHRTQTASDSTSRQSSASETSGTNESHSTTEGQSDSVTRTDGFTQGQSVSETDGVSASRGLTLSGAVTAGESAGETRGRTRTEGQSVGRTTGTSEGMSEGTAAGESRGESTGHATSRTRTTGKTPLSRSRIVTRPTGSLVRSVADQIAAVANVLASLPDRVVMVKCRGMGAPFLVQVHEVLDAYEDAGKTRPRAWKEAELRAYIAAVEAAHPYYFTPPPGREDRVARFLTDAPDRPLVVDAGGCRCGADAGRAAPPRPAGASGFIDD